MSVLDNQQVQNREVLKMKCQHITASLIVTASILVVSVVVAGQDRFTLTSPDGIAFSEFKGYDAWQVISPSQLDGVVKAIVGNPVMIKAFNEGIPVNGQSVPDGAVMAKIEWSAKSNPDLPGAARVPDTLKNVGFMVKDAKRFPDTDGWGYAQFDYDAAVGHVQAARQRAGVREGGVSPVPYALSKRVTSSFRGTRKGRHSCPDVSRTRRHRSPRGTIRACGPMRLGKFR